MKEFALNETNITVNVGDTAHITAIITPADAYDQNVTWRVAPTGRFVKLNKKGLHATLTCTKEGTYTVTATLGEFKAECMVTFTQPTNVENVSDMNQGTHKIIRNGQVQIINDGEYYSIKGEKL